MKFFRNNLLFTKKICIIATEIKFNRKFIVYFTLRGFSKKKTK